MAFCLFDKKISFENFIRHHLGLYILCILFILIRIVVYKWVLRLFIWVKAILNFYWILTLKESLKRSFQSHWTIIASCNRIASYFILQLDSNFQPHKFMLMAYYYFIRLKLSSLNRFDTMFLLLAHNISCSKVSFPHFIGCSFGESYNSSKENFLRSFRCW